MKYSVNPALRLKLEAWRSRLTMLVMALSLLGLIGRAVYLQGLNNEFLQRQGEARYSRVVKLSANRGMVLDRNGEPLAVSTYAEAVCASPKDIKISAAQLKSLAQLIDVKPAEINKRLKDARKQFVYLHRQVAPDTAAKVVALGIDGVFLQPAWRRNYPAGKEMAHLLGFTGIDDNGQEGIELSHDELLAGAPGAKRVIRNRLGQVVEETGQIQLPQPGKNLHLSIDRRIQYLAYRELKDALTKQKAKAAGIVVLDAKSGELLALVNLPDFNPNQRDGLTAKRIRNRSVTDVFEPGSTLKPFTVALALEQGKVHPNTVIETAPGRMTIGDRTIRDAHPHGKLTVAEIIQKSSNIGSAKIALALEARAMWELFHEVGFGHAPNSGLPGEAVGRVRFYKSWRPVEQATMSYGHGISVSLMQLARAYTVFANDGEIRPVSLVKQEHALSGTAVMSAKTARAVRNMLELAVQTGGTAPRAQIPGYRVAGKTGTAHKLKTVGRGYEADRYVSSFVGFAPVSDPRLVVAVMIDEPNAGYYYGGVVAAPVFSGVMAGALRLLGVPPDAPSDATRIPQPVDEVIAEEV